MLKSRFLLSIGIAGLVFLGQGCGGGSSSSGSSGSGGGQPQAGANVNESLETAIVYVDGTAGDDHNSGSQDAPFQTINKALQTAGANNQKSIGTQINVNPGTYREQLVFPATQTTLPFTLQATTAGTVYISGADSLPGNTWFVSSYGPDIYTNSSTANYIYPECATPPGWPPVPAIVTRREMVFVNGSRMNQVMFSNQLQPGTFWADAGGSNQIYVWPPAGINMAEADVEVSTASRSPLMNTDNVSNFVLRGLTFEYDNSCIQGGLRINSGTNVLVDDDKFLWNNGSGLGVFGGSGATANVTVQNSVANHNGQIGFGGNKVKYCLYQNDDSSYNSWRGAEGGYYEVGFNGSYFFLFHDSDFKGYTAYYNQSSGVHFDTDNANDQFTGLQSGGNNLEGLSIEASEGPFAIQNSNVCSNALDPTSKTANVTVIDSSDVSLTGNNIYNGPKQVYITGDGRAGTNWEQPNVPLVRFNQHFTETSNSFIGTADQVGFDTYYKDVPSCSVPIQDMWQTFGSTFLSQSNTWGDTAAGNSSYPYFQAAILGGTVPLSSWQSAPPGGVGQDSESQFVAKASEPSQCALPKPDMADFWLVLGPRGGAAVIVPQAGGPQIQIPLSLSSLGYSGNVSLSFDTTQEGGSPVAGVTGTFSPQKLALSPGSPPVPVASTLTVGTTSATPNGFYPLTVTASDGKSITRTGTFFLQVGSPSGLQFLGSRSIQAGSCAQYRIHTVDSSGNPSDVLNNTYLSVTGTGSGQFYQDSGCTSPVKLSPIQSGCPAGIEVAKGDYSPHFSGTGSIWFKDPNVENLTITISDEAGVLDPVSTPVQVQ